MNVLTITPRYTEHAGGDGLYAFHLVRGLREIGHSVSVLTLRQDRFVLLSETGAEPQIFGERSKDPFHEHFSSSAAADALRHAIASVRPDVIHIHGIHQYFTVSCVDVLRDARIPTVYTVHDYKLVCGNASFFSDRTEELCFRCLEGSNQYPLFERCKRGSFAQSAAAALQMGLWSLKGFTRLLTAVHAPSRYVGSLLEHNPELHGKIFTERHPLLFAPTGAQHTAEEPLSALFFGRMVPHKGGHIAAAAMHGIDLPVHFIGSGYDEERVRSAASGNPRAAFHGWKTQAEIRRFMGPGTIALLPYLAAETFCFAVLEAMMEGCIVITTARGAIPELVQHGVNGLIVDPPDAEGFRSAVRTLIADPALRQQLSAAARNAGADLLSVRDHAARIAARYSTII